MYDVMTLCPHGLRTSPLSVCAWEFTLVLETQHSALFLFVTLAACYKTSMASLWLSRTKLYINECLIIGPTKGLLGRTNDLMYMMIFNPHVLRTSPLSVCAWEFTLVLETQHPALFLFVTLAIWTKIKVTLRQALDFNSSSWFRHCTQTWVNYHQT